MLKISFYLLFNFTDRHLYAELYERIGIAVDTQNSGSGSLTAKSRGPHGNQVSTDVDKEEEGSYTVSFTPQEIGEYKTNVFWNDKEIQGSPFIVWVRLVYLLVRIVSYSRFASGVKSRRKGVRQIYNYLRIEGLESLLLLLKTF